MTGDPTVLFVDDERPLADGHAARLADDYDTLTAYGGRAGLEAARNADIVFLDRRMPGMSGKEVLEEIRDREYDCRVVMLTGAEPDADVVEMGFDDYLRKPVDAEELEAAIEELAADSHTDADDVLDALGDAKSRHCCRLLAETTLGARELAEATGYSRATVYRRLNALKQAGLVESQDTLDVDGAHYERFRAVPQRIRVDVGDGLRAEVEEAGGPQV